MTDHAEPGGSLGITITDVAAAAGVSIRTVSRVLNDSPKVSGDTRGRIEAAIDRLGFTRSARARALATGRSFLLGVVQDDPNAQVIGVFQRGIVEVCAALGYELVVHPAKVADPELTRNIEDFVTRSRVDGLILLPPISEIAAIPVALARLRVPSVGIASVRVPGYPAMLVSDERAAAGLLADHLVALGHRRIAMITGPLHFRSACERRQGFCDALHRHGVDLDARYVREGDYTFPSGLAAAATLLDEAAPPTAIFASNDIMAAAVLKFAAERRITVPGDLSVVGFDDSAIAEMVSPALTTIRRPLLDLARAATEQLTRLISVSPEVPHETVYQLTVVVRGSTGVAPGERK